MTFSVSRLMGEPVPEISERVHPLVTAERENGVNAAEAAARLGLSLRQYSRYRNSRSIPEKVCLLVELGALKRPAGPTSFGELLSRWRPE